MKIAHLVIWWNLSVIWRKILLAEKRNLKLWSPWFICGRYMEYSAVSDNRRARILN